MIKSYLKILSENDLTTIHNASLSILENTGMLIEHNKALEMLHDAGAKVDMKNQIARFPREMVEDNLKKMPKKFVYAGRDPKNDMIMEAGGNIYCRTTNGETAYHVLKTGEYRRAKIEDMVEFSKLVDALPNINGLGAVHSENVPAKTGDIHSLKVMLEHQRKNIITNAFSVKNLQYMIDMVLAVSGSKEEVRKRPIVHSIITVMSPLSISQDDVDQIITAGEYGIPTGMCIMVNTGMTGPITLAGTIAQTNAELLGSFTLSQVANPGHPVPYYTVPVVSDMRSGLAMMGSPENGLIISALCQLANELYKMPVETEGFISDGSVSEQTVAAKISNGLMESLSGGNLLMGAGIQDSALAASPVQLVIDDEIMGIIRRILRGIEFSNETLGLEAIDRVGPKGSFLTDEHTLKYLRSQDIFEPGLFDRNARNLWESKGRKGLVDIAREKAISILDKHEVEPLSDDITKELDDIIKSADKEITS